MTERTGPLAEIRFGGLLKAAGPTGARERPYLEKSRYFRISFRSAALGELQIFVDEMNDVSSLQGAVKHPFRYFLVFRQRVDAEHNDIAGTVPDEGATTSADAAWSSEVEEFVTELNIPLFAVVNEYVTLQMHWNAVS